MKRQPLHHGRRTALSEGRNNQPAQCAWSVGACHVSDLPMCGHCRRPVDKMTRIDDPMRKVTVFEVHCHGAVQRTEIQYELWMVMTSPLRPAVAFEPEPPMDEPPLFLALLA